MQSAVMFGIFIAWCAAINLCAQSEEFDTHVRPEEQDAVGRILQLGGQLRANNQGYISEVNLAYRNSINGMRMGNDLSTAEACDLLPQFRRLISLTLAKSQVSDKGLAHIGKLKNLQELAILDANKNPDPRGATYSDVGIEELAQLRELEVLWLHNAELSDRSLDIISELPRLRDLVLTGSHFTDAGIRKLSKLERLDRLNISSSRVSAVGLSELASLPLRSLNLALCGIDDRAMVEIGKLSQLEDIYLASASVTNEGLRHLLGKPLKTLGLGKTKITDEAFDVISSFKELKTLTLTRTDISEDSLNALIELRNLTNLDLPDSFGAEAIAALERANSALEITPADWHTMSWQRISVLGEGLQAFREKYGQFPATGPKDDLGQPMFSWRVAILPFIGEAALFERFHLDEPWNSEYNAQLIDEMPAAFECPGRKVKAGWTLYQAVVGEGTVLKQDTPSDLPKTADAKALILVTIASAAVPWTAPQDYVYDDEDPVRNLFGTNRLEYFYFTDGAKMVSDAASKQTFRSYFQLSPKAERP